MREILRKLKIKKSEMNNTLKMYDLEKVKLKEKKISVFQDLNLVIKNIIYINLYAKKVLISLLLKAAEEFIKRDENQLKKQTSNLLGRIAYLQNVEIKVETLVEKLY